MSTGSVAITHGIRVSVTPEFLPEQSAPDAGKYVWSYRIRIANESPRTVRLLSRHWVIIDADGDADEVRGEGVVGQTPEIAPGGSFSYRSFCPLQTPWGTMEGEFTFASGDELFEVEVRRFYLVAAATDATVN
jgi:ApaG protein